MNMVPAAQRPLLLEQLVNLIAENGHRLDTGFVSVPYLLDVLHDNGRPDVALKLLFQTECPSWLYEVERGATTIWERWDAIRPDGEVGLTSFNHYAFGCVGDWMYRVIAGLGKSAPGYKQILIQPEPPAELSHAQASYQSAYGEIVSAWERRDGQMRLEATIPPNTSATIRLPHANLADLDYHEGMQQDGPDVVVTVSSGSYQFSYPLSG